MRTKAGPSRLPYKPWQGSLPLVLDPWADSRAFLVQATAKEAITNSALPAIISELDDLIADTKLLGKRIVESSRRVDPDMAQKLCTFFEGFLRELRAVASEMVATTTKVKAKGRATSEGSQEVGNLNFDLLRIGNAV